MAEKDGDCPSLELPSLGFGRKRGKKAVRAGEDDTAAVPEQTPAEVPAPAPEPAPVAPELAEEPVPTEPPEEPVAPPEAETATLPREPEPTTTHAPPAPPPEPVAPPLFADEVADEPTRVDTPVAGSAPPRQRPVAPSPEPEHAHAAEHAAEKPKREFSLPPLSGMAAALVTGAVVGVLMVGLTGASFRLCEVIQGAPSCGDPGFLLLLAIVIVVIVAGKAMLAAWSVPDPGSTSFLAVGLLCVVALLFLVNVLFNWWMIIVIPALGMLCFALSHWVTTAFVDGDD